MANPKQNFSLYRTVFRFINFLDLQTYLVDKIIISYRFLIDSILPESIGEIYIPHESIYKNIKEFWLNRADSLFDS